MFLTEGEVRRLLDMQDAVRDMEEALRKRPPSRGTAEIRAFECHFL